MTYSKRQRINRELEKFYRERVNFYSRTNPYEADRLAAKDIYTKIGKDKENK